jgi:3-oxoacyl-[acyl-carrier protein] reductase
MIKKNLMKNKNILILGASSDIGEGVIQKFIKSGWNIYAHYNRNSKKLKFLKSKYSNQMTLIKADLSNTKKITKLIKQIKNKKILSIVNLVGYFDNKSYQNFTIESIIKTIKINSIAPIFIQRSLLGNMIKNKFGRILNISSIGVKYGGSNFSFSYSFSKKSLEYFPKYLKSITKYNILNNVLRIGFTNTKMINKVRSKNIKERVSLIPINRMANVKEVSDVIFNLASEKNTYISGETITIAGGE